jgi:hypothetical protein
MIDNEQVKILKELPIEKRVSLIELKIIMLFNLLDEMGENFGISTNLKGLGYANNPEGFGSIADKLESELKAKIGDDINTEN